MGISASRKRMKLAMAVGGVLVVLFVAGAVKNIVGDSRTSTAPTLEEVPRLGPLLAPLESPGPVVYAAWEAQRKYRYVIAGTTTAENLERFCEHWGLQVQPLQNPVDETALIEELGGDPAEFPTRFSPGDTQAVGDLHNIGHAYLLYDQQGQFLLTVSDTRPPGTIGKPYRE